MGIFCAGRRISVRRGKITAMAEAPQAVIIAGPNGSGKSTAATRLLTPGMPFVNADMIASELAGRSGVSGDIPAGRELIARLSALEAERADFAFETTLSSVGLAARVDRWRALGYEVHLVFFWLPSADLAVERVTGRVRDGGHHVPEDTVRRRFRAGLRNFFRIYHARVDVWRLYDNSTIDPAVIARGRRDESPEIASPDLWAKIAGEHA